LINSLDRKELQLRVSKVILTIGIASIAIAFPAFGSSPQSERDDKAGVPVSKDTYFGQTPPGKRAEVFAPEVLVHEPHDSPVISRDESWMIFFGMEVDVQFYEMRDGRLTLTSNPMGFEIPTVCNGVAISPSGTRVYMEEWKDGRGLLYYIDRMDDEWTAPTYVDLSRSGNIWQLSIASSGNLYFALDTVMVAAIDGDSHAKPVALRLEDNSVMLGDTPYISPDESYIIYSVGGDLHISYRLIEGKWTKPVDLGPNINSSQLDICPQISPNGKYLFFNSRRSLPTFAIFWADASFVEELRPKSNK
jgi:hypothetical protein